ncbi:MAG: hypothetical protein JXC85_00885 [Candidatus Aenigmarchaeota archaeon]|nr:hypothetical protein [Candidatus Aenigmarchaeota archaeon]
MVKGRRERRAVDVEESMLDIMERMETLVPEYSYSSIASVVKTDKKVRRFLLAELKAIKDYMFHVVQVSYELQRDKLSRSVEGSWDDLDSLVDRVENSKTSKMKGNRKYCEDCKKRIDENIHDLVRRDRELVIEVRDMKRTAHMLYKALFDKGNEARFIKNLDRIKKYVDQVSSLLDERERIITGE